MANDERPTLEQESAGNSPLPDSEPGHHRRRKKRVKRSSRIARKAGYVAAFTIAVAVLFAIWYYLVSRPTVPPPS